MPPTTGKAMVLSDGRDALLRKRRLDSMPARRLALPRAALTLLPGTMAAAVLMLAASARSDLRPFARLANGTGNGPLSSNVLTGNPGLRTARLCQFGPSARRHRRRGSTGTPPSRQLGACATGISIACHAPGVATKPLTTVAEVAKPIADEDGPWLMFGKEIDIAGVTAADAYAVYSHLPNHLQWSSLLTEVLPDSGLSEWSLNAFGVRLAWRARVTEEVAPTRIAWESVDRLRHSGWATFADVPPADGGNGTVCKVRLQLAFQTPWPLQRVLSSKSLATLAEHVLEQDLNRFAGVVTHGGAEKAYDVEQAQVFGPVTSSTYADNLGSCSATLWPYGDIEVWVQGFGTAGNTLKMLDNLAEGMETLAGRVAGQVDFRALIDLTRGAGCSPMAFPVIVRFLQGSGRLINRTAVLGPMPLMRIAQAVMMMARQQGVGFYSSRREAVEWLALPREVEGERGALEA